MLRRNIIPVFEKLSRSRPICNGTLAKRLSTEALYGLCGPQCGTAPPPEVAVRLV